MSDLKHFNENDVEFAKHLAKLSVSKEKVNIKPSILASDIKPKAISFDIALNDDKNNLPSNFDELHKSRPSGSHVKQKRHREGNMRIKQAMRTACDLATIIERLDRKSKEKQRELSFITPLELEKKNKRWDDFSHLARRSLYTLKREVNLLSVKVTTPLTNLPDSSLRLLASATRSCLHIVKGLENFEDEIKEKQKGNFLLREALLTGQHLLFIMTMGGASVSTKNSSNIKTDNGETSEENLTKSFEILTSDMDSKVSELLNPNAVKKKLSTLVQSLKAKNRKAKSQKLKYISPLQDELDYVEKSRNSIYPVCEDLDDGRKIEFVNDSLSPKLRKRNLRHVRKISSRHRRDDGNESSPRKNQSPEEDEQYGVSEKMADAVFERILPYINGIEDKEVAGTSRHPNNSNVEIVVLFEAQKKLDELQRRFRKLETTTQKHKQFITKIKSKLSKNTEESSDALDLDKVIKKANICLEKCSKSENTFPYQESSVDVIVDNLLMARAQETDQKVLTKKSEFTSMHDEVQALKIEFWNSMADKHVIRPSTSGIPPLASVGLPSTSPPPPLHFTSTSVDILGKKEANERILKDDMPEENMECNSEEIFYKSECNLLPNETSSMEKENQSVPRNSLQDIVTEDEKEDDADAVYDKNEPIITQKSMVQSSNENGNSESIVISETVKEDPSHESSEAMPSQVNTDASAEQTDGPNSENSSKDF